MNKKKVYASIEIADSEVRLVVLETFEARQNVLRVECTPCAGVKNQTIVDEVAVINAIRKCVTQAQAALGYRIERVLLAIPSINVERANQKVRVQIEDGTKNIRLFHVQQGLTRAFQRKLGSNVELVNANRIQYVINNEVTQKMPIGLECKDFYMDVDLLYADKEAIFKYVYCIEKANLEVLDICLDSYAIGQETAAISQSLDRPIIQLDIEKDSTNMTYFGKGKLMTCANLEVGYSSFVNELKEKYNLTDEVCFRLLQNIFSNQIEENSEVIVYIEQQGDVRVEITARELAESCIPKIRDWIADVNEMCSPIVDLGKAKYIITGKGANIAVLKQMEKAFNAPASVYKPNTIGARDGGYACCLGMAYVWNDINRIRHKDVTSPNNNELEASIDSIKAKSGKSEGGFTKKLRSVILNDNK
ncbi:MAG: hypothetical protein KBT48_09880 [Firmicutes bacterium]|nr:hypothetical protein [Bacillota bacterium]